jgi:hypothetical protein
MSLYLNVGRPVILYAVSGRDMKKNKSIIVGKIHISMFFTPVKRV